MEPYNYSNQQYSNPYAANDHEFRSTSRIIAKKMPKSSTMLFNEPRNHQHPQYSNDYFNQKFYSPRSHPTFGHSISSDNIGSMLSSQQQLNEFSLSNKLKHVTYRSNENNYMPVNHKWKEAPCQREQPNQQQQQHQQQHVSMNDPHSNKDQIVLHVQNLDYKISADEWKRILLENFRKHCKEVCLSLLFLFILVYFL